jgi:hypothetical protein
MSQDNLENSTNVENSENSTTLSPESANSSQGLALGEAAPITGESLSSSEPPEVVPTQSEQSDDPSNSLVPDRVKSDETPKRNDRDKERIREGQKLRLFGGKPSKKSSGANSEKDKEQVQTEQIPEPTQRKYASYRSEYINQLVKQTKDEIDIINEEIQDLNEKIRGVVESLKTITDGTEHFRSQKRLQVKFEQERSFKRQDRDNLEETVTELQKELETRQQIAQSEQDDTSTEIEQISLKSFFSEETPIENAMLYAATFFPKLSAIDFQSIVSSLLKGQLIEIKNTRQETANDGTQKTVEIVAHKDLVEVWNESFCKPNTLLEKCYLELRRDGYTQYIDFVSPNLRNRLLDFFENKHPFYVEGMLKNIEELSFFDSSSEISERVAIILSEVIVYQSNRYQPDWLIHIIEEVKSGTKSSVPIVRVAEFLYRIQLRLRVNDAISYIEEFLNKLLVLDEELTFRIVLHLLYQHLCWSLSEVNGIEAVKHLLNWLKGFLNIHLEDSTNREERLAYRAFNVVVNLLSQEVLWDSCFPNYFYELLDFLRDWLPEPGRSVDEDDFLSLISLTFLPNYLTETLEKVQGERLRKERRYGVYPPKYPPLNLDAKNFSSNGLDETSISKISLLVRWLFYPFTDLNQNAIYVLESTEMLSDNLIKLNAKFILEWFAILLGFDLDKPSSEGSKITTALLQQIILIAPKNVQKTLSQSFAEIADELLDLAAEFEHDGESELSKECRNRRSLAKVIRKNFNEQKDLMKE